MRRSADERVYDHYSDMAGAYRRTLCISHHIMLTLDLRQYGQREMLDFALPPIVHECVRSAQSHRSSLKTYVYEALAFTNVQGGNMQCFKMSQGQDVHLPEFVRGRNCPSQNC